jgi:transcriptional regulator GlxA family with amidase domain
MTAFIEFDPTEHAQMFGIRFKPVGITAFTRIPLIEFTDRSEKLALVETLFDKSFYEILSEKRSTTEFIAHTNNYLINLLPHLYHTDEQIVHAIDTINLAKGQLSLADLATDVCLSQRHFERRFKATTGITPKMFAKTARFQHAMENILAYPNKDLMTIAIDSGYYDRTHLTNDFKSLSGETPNDLRKKSIFYAYGDVYSP